MALTSRQETFCYEVIKQPTISAAYHIAYNTKNTSEKTVNEAASRLMRNSKIVARVEELKGKIEKKQLYSLERSIRRDLSLIQRYEDALDVLENCESDTKAVKVAKRTIRYISVSGYNSAQDRISKQSGYFEKHNSQKVPNRIIVEMSDYKKDNPDED